MTVEVTGPLAFPPLFSSAFSPQMEHKSPTGEDCIPQVTGMTGYDRTTHMRPWEGPP